MTSKAGMYLVILTKANPQRFVHHLQHSAVKLPARSHRVDQRRCTISELVAFVTMSISNPTLEPEHTAAQVIRKV